MSPRLKDHDAALVSKNIQIMINMVLKIFTRVFPRAEHSQLEQKKEDSRSA